MRSLALPGSYHEKVTHLSRSLIGFTRLKQLDLSRNALRSLEVHSIVLHCMHTNSGVLILLILCTVLQGLDHLKMLEALNMYPTVQ